MLVTLPSVFTIDESRAGNPVQQVGELGGRREGAVAPFTRGHLHGFLFQPNAGTEPVLIVPKTRQIPGGYARVVQGVVESSAEDIDLSDGPWLAHPLLNSRPGAIEHEQAIQQVLDSWIGAFSYAQEDPLRNVAGLRAPQIGAVHAAHAHWSDS